MENCREMEAALVRKSGEEEEEVAFWEELKRISSMAAPMVAVTVSQYLMEVVSLMMVGHLGVLVSFSGVAVATSFAEVTGFIVLVNTTLLPMQFFFISFFLLEYIFFYNRKIIF